jgi:hypothetical protein
MPNKKPFELAIDSLMATSSPFGLDLPVLKNGLADAKNRIEALESEATDHAVRIAKLEIAIAHPPE